FIRLPNLNNNHLTLSGLVMTTPKTGAGAAPNNSGADAVTTGAVNASTERAEKGADKGSQSGDLQASAYVRRFPRTGLIQYGAAVYNPPPEKKTGFPKFPARAKVSRDAKPFYQLPPRTLEFSPGVNPKRFDYVGRLQLNDFPVGDYVLRL